MASLSLRAAALSRAPSNDSLPPAGPAPALRVLAFDVDGVFTDGNVYFTPDGVETKRIAFRDLDALGEARRAGITIALITGEQGKMADALAGRIGAEVVFTGAKDKGAALDDLALALSVPIEAICYVGDADRDAPALARSGLGLCPADASALARRAAHRTLSCCGGQGAVAEAVRVVLELQELTRPSAAERAILERIAADSLEAHRRFAADAVPVVHRIALRICRALKSGGKVLLCGNGGSAADAQHVAAELMGRFFIDRSPWPAIALTTDSSILTAVGNDWEFTDVFARQVRGLARPGDVVVGITTSGKSQNVIRALDAARAASATTIGFTGASGTTLASHTDVCFVAPSSSTPRIQELHLLAWHSICELVELLMTEESK